MKSSKAKLDLIELMSLFLCQAYDPFFTDEHRFKILKRLLTSRKRMARDIIFHEKIYRKSSLQIYKAAIQKTSKQIGRRIEVFPSSFKFKFTQLIDQGFVPEPTELPFKPWQITNGADIMRDLQQSGFHFDTVRPHDDMKCKYYALEKKISTKLCTIAVATPDKTKSLVDSVLFSVNKNPKVLFNKKFPEKYLAEVLGFIRTNEITLKKYWDGTYCSADLFENLKNHLGYWFIERGIIGSFKSGSDEFKVWVFANDPVHVRLINTTKKYTAEVNFKTFEGTYYDGNKSKHFALKKGHIKNFKKFLNVEIEPRITNRDKLTLVWHAINEKADYT